MPKGKKRDKYKFWKVLGKILWFIIKIPYYIVRGIAYFLEKVAAKTKRENVETKKRSMKANYVQFEIIERESGDLDSLEKNITGKSKIGIILGARGTGKTAFGMKLMENIYSKTKKKCYAMGFRDDEMPSWIEVVENISEINNNSIVLVDEGGILFSSRRAMTTANKILSDLILISRHKNLSIMFISQNSSNLDVNIIRQADYLILKPSSLLQKDFERKIVKKLYEKVEPGFKKHSKVLGLTYIYSDDFRGFVANDLPSFWSERISKSFR